MPSRPTSASDPRDSNGRTGCGIEEAGDDLVKVAITGASGLIGSAVRQSLEGDGHEVLRLVRRPADRSGRGRSGTPRAGSVDARRLAGVDAVVHLAGAGVGDRRWTASYKREIRDSRLLGTRTLAEPSPVSTRKPAVLVSGSAIGYYGDTGDERRRRVVTRRRGLPRPGGRRLGGLSRTGRRCGHPRRPPADRPRGRRQGRRLGTALAALPARASAAGSAAAASTGASCRCATRCVPFASMIDDPSMSRPLQRHGPEPRDQRRDHQGHGRAAAPPDVRARPGFVLKTVLGEMSQEVLGSARVLPDAAARGRASTSRTRPSRTPSAPHAPSSPATERSPCYRRSPLEPAPSPMLLQ